MVLLVEGTGYFVKRLWTGDGTFELGVNVIATSDNGDTLTVDFGALGGADAGLVAINGYGHTATSSAVITEAPTCVVASGVVTITIVSSYDDDARYFRLLVSSKALTWA